MPAASVVNYVILSGILFVMGGVGVIVRRSPLVMLMSVELMWNAANLLFLTFARQWSSMSGHVFAFLVITVAASEVAIGLALIVLLFRKKDAIDADDVNELRG